MSVTEAMESMFVNKSLMVKRLKQVSDCYHLMIVREQFFIVDSINILEFFSLSVFFYS